MKIQQMLLCKGLEIYKAQTVADVLCAYQSPIRSSSFLSVSARFKLNGHSSIQRYDQIAKARRYFKVLHSPYVATST